MAVIGITFVICLMLSIPVSFALVVTSLVYLFIQGIPLFNVAKQIVVGMDSYVLIAITAFILAGQIMNSAKITNRIFNFARTMVGHIPGGLAHANVVASIIFAGMSGSAIADAGGLGRVEIEGMVNQGYPIEFSAAVTAASSLIGPIIPPSIVAVIYASQAGVSVAAIFVAGVIPGLTMGLFMMVQIYFMAIKRNYPKDNKATFIDFLRSLKATFFSLLSPLIILGGIFFGVFTPTEASVIAVVYSIILGLVYKTINLKSFYQILIDVTRDIGQIGFLIAAAVMFSWVLTHARIPVQIAGFLLSISENPLIILLIINVFLLFVGCFMDGSAAILILTPIFLPIITKMQFNLIHFGIMMILNLMIGLLTPPVGMVLYVVATVAKIRPEKLIIALLPFFIPLLLVLCIIILWPDYVLFLPRFFNMIR